MSLEELRRRSKYCWYASALSRTGSKVLDMPGMGPFIDSLFSPRKECYRLLTLSEDSKACQNNDLNVIVKDCRTVNRDLDFYAISASVAWAFLSIWGMISWKTEQGTANLLSNYSRLMHCRRRFYMQTWSLPQIWSTSRILMSMPKRFCSACDAFDDQGNFCYGSLRRRIGHPNSEPHLSWSQ